MKRITILVLILMVFPLPSQAVNIPHVQPEMQTASFWIARDPKVEEVLFDAEGLKGLNRAIYNHDEFMYRLEDIEEELCAEEVKDLIGDPELPPRKLHYQPSGKIYPLKFYQALEKNLNLAAIPDKVKVVFGLTIARTNLRTHPTAAAALKKPQEKDFDRFQETSLEPAQFVAKLHNSQDGKFAYVITANTRGWVLNRDIAWAANKKEILEYVNAPRMLVNLAPEAGVYLDVYGKYRWGRIHMGTVLPLLKSGKNQPWLVKIPRRDDQGKLVLKQGYISSRADVREGYLPYTGANILRQAFKLLGDPYDWGGKKGHRDCSQFLMEVFAACGVNLPRNSFYQADAAAELFDLTSGEVSPSREEILKTARAGLTLLQLPGHIMLYLGEYQGRFYVIHDLWAYADSSEKKGWSKTAQVTVTDLSLGENTALGSLLQRTTMIVEVNHIYPEEEESQKTEDRTAVQETESPCH